jgi:hypothetical protein
MSEFPTAADLVAENTRLREAVQQLQGVDTPNVQFNALLNNMIVRHTVTPTDPPDAELRQENALWQTIRTLRDSDPDNPAVQALAHGLTSALSLIGNYRADIRDSTWTGVDLVAKGFCQGSMYRDAYHLIQSEMER